MENEKAEVRLQGSEVVINPEALLRRKVIRPCVPRMVRAELPGRDALATGRKGFSTVVIIRIKCDDGFCSDVTARNSFCKRFTDIH